MKNIYFWQTMVTPHMSPLAISLSKYGHKVNFIAEVIMSKDRIETGWSFQDLPNVNTIILNGTKNIKSIVLSSGKDSIHICQGLRNNGKVKIAQKFIRKFGYREWIIIETVNEKQIFGFLKKALYRILSIYHKNKIEAILAIGKNTKDWLIDRGFDKKKIFSFAYFLSNQEIDYNNNIKSKDFEFIFIGNLIKRKNIDLLLKALSYMEEKNFYLKIVGNGPEYKYLKKISDKLLPDKVIWIGRVKFHEIPYLLSRSDCLVLPSIHDGWGAVVSEALIAGTQVICSDTCGVSEVVVESNYGNIFESNNIESLYEICKNAYNSGKIDKNKRESIKSWSKFITSEYGAHYLIQIINHLEYSDDRPLPPWYSSKN